MIGEQIAADNAGDALAIEVDAVCEPPESVVFEEILPRDIPKLKALHDECFPVHYNERFYNNVSKREYMGKPLITWIARQPAQLTLPQVANYSDTPKADGTIRDQEDSFQYIIKRSDGVEEEWAFLGGITAQLTYLDPDDDQQPLLSQESTESGYTRGCYVLTLATNKMARRKGIGSALLRHVLDVAARCPDCGAVYLHVITYNQGAIDFYTRHGFTCVDRIENFYNIDGKHYDSFLFAKFLGQAKPGARKVPFWTSLINQFNSFILSVTNRWLGF